jgi:DNA-binding SARP family transcriptional activator
MRFEILGQLRLVDAGNITYISAPKTETLCAILLARTDQTVPSTLLIEEIWGGGALRQATASLHVHISQLRKLLARPGGGNPIVTQPGGYRLDTTADEVDVVGFHALAEAARAELRVGRFEAALDSLEAALQLWRGPAFGRVVDSQTVTSYATLLDEERLGCLELLFEVALMLGRHREVVGRLYALTAAYPLRESYYRLLMVALYRSERQAAALEVYRDARERLNTEVGLEPCRSLRDLNQAILVGDDHVGPRIVLPEAV